MDTLQQEEDRLFKALIDFGALVVDVACDGLDGPDIHGLLDDIDYYWDQQSASGVMVVTVLLDEIGKKTHKPIVHEAIEALKPALLQYRDQIKDLRRSAVRQ
ncbi:MAG: hypothetical protein ACXW14_10355 [Burkholderiaceae bacterium]